MSTGLEPDTGQALRSPAGLPLRRDSAYTLTDGETRWPVVNGIPWLRAGRDGVRARAVAALDADDPAGAEVVLLTDCDDWWDGEPPTEDAVRAAMRATTLREAAELLAFGRVGTYFAHRWSDPSWAAALALTAAHPPDRRPVVDLACGAGHLLRHLALHGHAALTGIDVVYAKLWLARRFVIPPTADCTLLCADLTYAWPLPPAPHDGARYVACHDALYFLADKEAFVAQALRCSGPTGAVVLGHCHNRLSRAGGGGLPLEPADWAALLPQAALYAEEELTAAAVDGRLPHPSAPPELADTEAVGLAWDGAGAAARPELLDPAPGVPLTPNPLYEHGVRRWPGERWAAEYGDRASSYLPPVWPTHGVAAPDATRRRLLLDLPAAW